MRLYTQARSVSESESQMQPVKMVEVSGPRSFLEGGGG